jgi:hypothetical protein
MNDTMCALCGRRLGVKAEAHHLNPKTYGGRETVPLHPICHRKIHETLSERALRDRFHTIDALRAQPDIAAFLRWIANKPPDFHTRTETSRAKRRG